MLLALIGLASGGCAVKQSALPLNRTALTPPLATLQGQNPYGLYDSTHPVSPLLFEGPPPGLDAYAIPPPGATYSPTAAEPSLFDRVVSDHQQFYSQGSLTRLAIGGAVGGIVANTKLDQEIQTKFQSGVRGATSDDWFESLHAGKELGNGLYTLPVYGTAWAIGELFPESSIATTAGDWGERTTRGFLIGAPPVIALQSLVGGSRPEESSKGSQWTPLQDNNGISGHSFMGSLPFITAAKMSERPLTKAAFYTASAVVPLSRVNDNAHYTSQAALGWFVAYLAADAVNSTEVEGSRLRLMPYVAPGESGFVAEYAY